MSGRDPIPSDPGEWTGVVEKTGKKITVRRNFDGCLQECKKSEIYKFIRVGKGERRES